MKVIKINDNILINLDNVFSIELDEENIIVCGNCDRSITYKHDNNEIAEKSFHQIIDKINKILT